MNGSTGDRGLGVALGAFLATLVVLIPLGSQPAQARACKDVVLGNGWRWVVGGDDRHAREWEAVGVAKGYFLGAGERGFG